MKKNLLSRILLILGIGICIFGNSFITFGQGGAAYDKKSDPKTNRREGLNMLKLIYEVIQKEYYDPKFKGIDMQARYKAAEEQIKSQEFRWQIHRTIAQFLLDLDDSHTNFLPPDRLFHVEYGFSILMVGNACYVTEVKKGSNAEKQGLRSGDRIDVMNGIAPSRGNLWAINYLIYTLDPQEVLKLQVTKIDGKKSELSVNARFLSPKEMEERQRARRKDESTKPFLCNEITTEIVACKLRTFMTSKGEIDKMMKIASGYKKLILDLRGNGGGYVDTNSHLLSYFFAESIKIGTEVRREKQKERFTDKRNNNFSGDLIVLIDSDSASASEVFAKVIQIEKRGRIVGDTSMGAVMASIRGFMDVGGGTAAMNRRAMRAFGLSVTVADLIMSDGSRLEAIGVSPDHSVGPSPLAISQRNDPILAFAVELAGAAITPEKAGEFNFFVPKLEDDNDKDSESITNRSAFNK